MSVWDWLSKKMDEDMPRDSFAEQVKKWEQEQDEWMERIRQEQEQKRDEELKKLEQETEEAEERQREQEQKVAARIKELKQAFEASGRKYNSAEPCEVETLLTLTEKKIIQQCRRPQCHGCKLGWICPKFWAE